MGWLPRSFSNNLRPFLGREVELLASLPGAGLFGEDGPAYVLAPHAVDVDQSTDLVGRLTRGLAENEAMPEESLGDELQVGRGRPGGAAGWVSGCDGVMVGLVREGDERDVGRRRVRGRRRAEGV